MARRSAGEGMLRQRPNGSWEGRYVAADGRKRSLYRRTKREATDALREALGQADSGILPVDRQLTTAVYLADWLEHDVKPTKRPSTFATYTNVVDHYIVPHIGRVPLAKLAPEHVQAMLAKVAEDHALRTVAFTRTVLRTALARAEKHGRVRRNVAALVDPPKVPRNEVQPFTAEEARKLLAAVKDRDVAPLITTALGTGARQGELLALRWRDVDLKSGTIAIRPTLQRDGTLAEPKTERSPTCSRAAQDRRRRAQEPQGRTGAPAPRCWSELARP